MLRLPCISLAPMAGVSCVALHSTLKPMVGIVVTTSPIWCAGRLSIALVS
jgi:hypothetical protein